jgi:hypothetical protein
LARIRAYTSEGIKTSCIISPGIAVTNDPVIHALKVYVPALNISALDAPDTILPSSIEETRLMYKSAYVDLVLTNFIIRPHTRPYTASSTIIDGSLAIGGILVIIEDKNGAASPQISPYCHPHISPQISTGMCIGRKIDPAFCTEWKAIGSTRHIARQTAAKTIFFVFVSELIYMSSLLTVYFLDAKKPLLR